MILEPREAREFCVEVFLAFEPAINGTPCAGREINQRQVAFSHQLVNRPVGFGKQIVQFYLRPLRGDARQSIANSTRGAVVAFSEARRENQYSFFHSLSGHRNADGKLASRGKEDGSIRSLMDIYIGQSKLPVPMKYLGFLWRVLRRLVWETATDTTTGLAAQMACLLLFALAPGSLFLWHLLGFFRTDPAQLHAARPESAGHSGFCDGECGGDRLERPPRERRHHSRNLFWDCLHCHDLTRSESYLRNAGRSPLVVEVYHFIFHAVLVRNHHRLLLQRNRLWRTAGRSCRSQFSAGLFAASIAHDA